MARATRIALLVQFVFALSAAGESVASFNSNGAVMITNQWQQKDCMVRNCLQGKYYETASRNASSVIQRNHQIHLAVLLPSKPIDTTGEQSKLILSTTLPVIELAIKSVKEQQLLEGYELLIHHRDTNCSSIFGPMAAFDLYNRQEADVFFGPICDYVIAPVARYAGVWERPVLTTGGMAYAFNNKVSGQKDRRHTQPQHSATKVVPDSQKHARERDG
jgi:Receptor family ligand binding region